MAGAAATNLSFIFYLVIVTPNYLYSVFTINILLQENESLQAVKHADTAISLDRYNAHGNEWIKTHTPHTLHDLSVLQPYDFVSHCLYIWPPLHNYNKLVKRAHGLPKCGQWVLPQYAAFVSVKNS